MAYGIIILTINCANPEMDLTREIIHLKNNNQFQDAAIKSENLAEIYAKKNQNGGMMYYIEAAEFYLKAHQNENVIRCLNIAFQIGPNFCAYGSREYLDKIINIYSQLPENSIIAWFDKLRLYPDAQTNFIENVKSTMIKNDRTFSFSPESKLKIKKARYQSNKIQYEQNKTFTNIVNRVNDLIEEMQTVEAIRIINDAIIVDKEFLPGTKPGIANPSYYLLLNKLYIKTAQSGLAKQSELSYSISNEVYELFTETLMNTNKNYIISLTRVAEFYKSKKMPRESQNFKDRASAWSIWEKNNALEMEKREKSLAEWIATSKADEEKRRQQDQEDVDLFFKTIDKFKKP